MTDVLEKARHTIEAHELAAKDAAVLLMVSGGSDSTALAYLGAALREAGDVGPVAMLHVNHQLRGEDADADERFVAALAEALDIPLFICSIDIAAEAERSRENVEAVARRERYLAANEALRSMCQHEGRPLSEAVSYTHLLDLPGVLTVLAGASTLDQMRDNMATFQSHAPLTEAERAAIDGAIAALHSVDLIPCTNCGYCVKDCPEGVKIPIAMNLLNLEKTCEDNEFVKGLYSWQAAEGPASKCIQCGTCEAMCPQSIGCLLYTSGHCGIP